MGAKSKIEWTDASWTPIRARRKDNPKSTGWFCVHESEGCRNCYAEAMNRRLGTGLDFKAQNRCDVEIFLDEKLLIDPLRWKRPRKIFVCSMTDLFGEFVSDSMIDRIFAVMALCPQHTFIVLTKRAERMRKYLAAIGDDLERINYAAFDLIDFSKEHAGIWPLPNVWLGVSVEDQKNANERILHLLNTPAAIRFVSCEPLLGPLNLRNVGGGIIDLHNALTGHWEDDNDETGSSTSSGKTPHIDWVICGGESGPHARPMHPAWARSLRDQCAAAGVPFFFKQWGGWAPGSLNGDWMIVSKDGDIDAPDYRSPAEEFGETAMTRICKKNAGRLLDGRTHDQFP